MLYDMIFKRKSFHVFKDIGHSEDEELREIEMYNQIDMGIFLLILELCLRHEGIAFERELYSDDGDLEREWTKTAVYQLLSVQT